MTPGLVDALHRTLWWADHAVLGYFLVINTFYALLLILSIPELWEHWRLADNEHLQRLLASDALPPLTIMVPAHNEEVTIASSLLSFLTLEYPHFEVVLVNDGSKDATLSVLVREFDLYQVPAPYPTLIPTKRVFGVYRSRKHARLVVIDKENGGKADSLNAALNAARFEYVLAVDADTLIEPDALLRLARPFLLGTHVAAVGGTVRVANACRIELGRVVDAKVDRRWLPGCQVVEYLRAFLFGRLGWNRLGGSLIISGAFGMFRREYLLAIEGYRTGNVTEDMDLVVRLHRYLYEHDIHAKMPFIPDPVAWTEVPTTVKVLHRQRERWHRGLLSTVITHRGLLFNPKYGKVGMVSFPFFVFGELLAPVVELFGYLFTALGLWLHAVDWHFALLFFLVAVGYGSLLSVWAVVLEDVSFRKYRSRWDFLRLLAFSIIEGLGFRQMTVWFRLHAFWKYFRGHEGWGTMTREGFGPARVKP
ncbi:MAG: glycosyltransferase family 2 protein [Gemmatimonadetes bacterium]|nr:glycosyltransferase family 2 protein [Gemmatimonadota bacterium]MBI3567598.1 glycosyltransferase family 2 protein [Gemmatimonadota bacterium]